VTESTDANGHHYQCPKITLIGCISLQLNIIEDQSDSDSDIESDNLGTNVITSYENNHSKDTVEEENQVSHDDDNVHANQAPTPTDLEKTNVPYDDHND
jgi:hypothetical protein